MRDITRIMDELVTYAHTRPPRNMEQVIQNHSEECIMLKHELDKLRSQHDERLQSHTHHEVSYPVRRSSESIASQPYFTSSTEYKSRDPNLVHQHGVLKRHLDTDVNIGVGSTPTFKPGQVNNTSNVLVKDEQDDTLGNKFDELEKRLISLENTLDSKPNGELGVNNDKFTTLKSYNPFSPDQNERVYVAENVDCAENVD